MRGGNQKNQKRSSKMYSREFRRRKEVAGQFPEFGAIFMSNRSTREECFERGLLGLPGSSSDFVTRVQAGMILFLFEHEERKLYGVFKAISDGGINLVPDAYTSSGRSYPAQVEFAPIWHCDPLSENEFRDAIRDNYFDKHKFNFGLSEDQVQSLVLLFSSTKLEIREPVHNNKRKNIEGNSDSIEAGPKKGRFAKIQIPGRKLNMDIAEAEVGRQSESIHFGDEAYDPENPGFDHSGGSWDDSASGIESHKLLTLQQKKGNLNVSVQETEDYIPLFSPEHSDLEEDGFDFDGCSEEKQIELGMFLGNKMFFPVPQFPPSVQGCNQMKMDHLFASPPGSNRLDDSSIASPHGSDHPKSHQPKGMYADNTNKKASVFSRLNFSSKHVASGNQNHAGGKKLITDVLTAKQECQYQCEKMEMVTRQKLEIDGYSLDRRTSVFMRLTSASYAVDRQVTGFKEGSGGWKKGKEKGISSEWKHEYKVENYSTSA